MENQTIPQGVMKSGGAAPRRGKDRALDLANLGGAFASDRARFIALAGFMLLVALTGGSSRADIASLILLRPLAILFAVYALFVARAGELHKVRVPLIVVLALQLLALVQLVPLPSAIWTSLPNRDSIGELSALLGYEEISRPFSLDPNRTWNSFFALFVPLAAICLAAIQGREYRGRIVPALMAVGLLSALLGFLQAIGGNGLHLYDITHRDFPVGLFANKNHQSVLLLWLMLAACWMASSLDPKRHSANVVIGGALGLILVLFPLLILAGSRAALALTPFALALCAWLLFRAPAAKVIRRRVGKRARLFTGIAAACLAAPLVFVFAVLAVSERQTALSRLFELDAASDVRLQYTPTFLQMMRDFMPFGSGLGSFEEVFNMYEPANMLSVRYMNQAHNDFLQVAMEGGIPAIAIFGLAFAWYLHRCWRLWRSQDGSGRAPAIFFVSSLLLWLAASAVDYPLRTPLAATLLAALTVQLCFLSSDRLSGPGKSRSVDARRDSRRAE